MVVGVVLFLYGSNYYDVIVGWVGVFLVVVGFFTFVTLKLYEKLKKVESD
jgi:hypothetical protein